MREKVKRWHPIPQSVFTWESPSFDSFDDGRISSHRNQSPCFIESWVYQTGQFSLIKIPVFLMRFSLALILLNCVTCCVCPSLIFSSDIRPRKSIRQSDMSVTGWYTFFTCSGQDSSFATPWPPNTIGRRYEMVSFSFNFTFSTQLDLMSSRFFPAISSLIFAQFR